MANAYVAREGIYARELRRFLNGGSAPVSVMPAKAGIQILKGSLFHR
jgi:hypothetical protein